MKDEPTPPTLTTDTPAGAGLIWTPGPEMYADRALRGYYTGRNDEDGLCERLFEIQPETWPPGSTLWVDATETALTGVIHDVHPPDPVHAVLDGGWTISAPEGTDKAVLDFVVDEFKHSGHLRSVDDAADEIEERAERARRDAIGPMHGPSTYMQHLLGEQVRRTLDSTMSMTDFLFRETAMTGAVFYETVRSMTDIPQHEAWFTSNPGSDSEQQRQFKRRFIDAEQPYHWRAENVTDWAHGLMRGPDDETSKWKREYHGNWTHDVPRPGDIIGWDPADTLDSYGHFEIMGEDGKMRRLLPWDPSGLSTVEALAAKWAARPPARPGWTGSISGPPRPIPLKPTPWQTLPKGMITERGKKRTVIIEPGADSNPDARRLELQGGKWVDVGPWFPNGLPPAYRGQAAPIPWDSPLADPMADLRAAGGGTAYGEHRERPNTDEQ